MLEMDMDLETELGVDSIKRVEILSDVQAQLGIEAQDVAALGRTRTVGEVVDAMKAEILNAGGSSSAPVQQQQQQSYSAPVQQQSSGSSGVSTAKAVEVVLEVLANKTGYETDMLEMDMDLETELGVDSIKRVEILSDVQAQLGIEAQDVAALGRTRTVGEVVDAMKAEILNAGGSSSAPVQQQQQQSYSAPVQQSSGSSGVSTAKAVEVVLEVLANKTGYETDMLEMDMDLETELGVDSIKRVEILSDVQAQLGIEAQDVAALGRTRTVGEVVDAMKAEILNAGGSSSAPVQQQQQQSYSAPVQQSSGSSGVSTAKAVEVVLEVLANKTGYETDMLEMDMDLETELGVDSIKRVEILSDVQAQLGIEAQDVAALGRTRTVGEVVDAMKAEILNAGGSSSAPVQQQQQQSYSAPVQQQSYDATPARKAAPISSGVSTAKAVEVVLEVLANKTGYETDMLEMDMDLETELGVDSIKRVEILSDVQAQLGIEAQDVAALGRTRTVGEVVDAMKAEILNAGGSATPAPQTPNTAALNVSTAAAVEVVLEVLANKTGYETDMLEMDMDLETELGVDSIKRVEILSDVQAQLGIEAQDVAALGRTRTVGEVVDAMKAEIVMAAQGGMATPAPSSGMKSRTATPARARSLGDTASVSLTYAHLVSLPHPDRLSLNAPSNRPFVIVDDNTSTTAELARQFGQRAVVLSFRGGNFQKRTGLNQLIVPDTSEESLKRTLNTVQSSYGAPGGLFINTAKVQMTQSNLDGF